MMLPKLIYSIHRNNLHILLLFYNQGPNIYVRMMIHFKSSSRCYFSVKLFRWASKDFSAFVFPLAKCDPTKSHKTSGHSEIGAMSLRCGMTGLPTYWFTQPELPFWRPGGWPKISAQICSATPRAEEESVTWEGAGPNGCLWRWR